MQIRPSQLNNYIIIIITGWLWFINVTSSSCIHWHICCKARKFSLDKFSLISLSENVHSFNFHYSLAVLFYIITKVKFVEAFNSHGFVSSAEIAKINRRWNFLVLQYHPDPDIWGTNQVLYLSPIWFIKLILDVYFHIFHSPRVPFQTEPI